MHSTQPASRTAKLQPEAVPITRSEAIPGDLARWEPPDDFYLSIFPLPAQCFLFEIFYVAELPTLQNLQLKIDKFIEISFSYQYMYKQNGRDSE